MRLKDLIQTLAKGPVMTRHPSVSENGMSVIGQPYLNLVLSWRVDRSLDAAVQPMGTTHSQPVL